MGTRREVNHDFNNTMAVATVAHSETRPENEWQALMECMPGQGPEASRVELAPLRDLIADAIEHALDERERWVFDAIYCRCMSLRALGRELSLSKTHVIRIRESARQKLIVALLAHDQVREYLNARV